jgi:uncharacterized protein
MARRITRYALAAGLILCWLPAAFALDFPALSGRVVDDANVMTDTARSDIDAKSKDLEDKSGIQLVVATVKSLQGSDIETFANQLFRFWKLGEAKKNNGVLLLVAPKEHKVRIEVGYGLEGQLTDAQTEIVIQRYMVPAFKRGDYNGGIVAGTNAVLQLLGGVTLTPPPQTSGSDQDQQDSHGGFPWGFIVIILVWVVFGRFLWPLLFLGGLGGGRRGGWGGGGFGGGGFGGGGFGGGGFSGGGGGFGGGGASGSW